MSNKQNDIYLENLQDEGEQIYGELINLLEISRQGQGLLSLRTIANALNEVLNSEEIRSLIKETNKKRLVKYKSSLWVLPRKCQTSKRDYR
jgi:K+-sensing histidine kinase KdpD